MELPALPELQDGHRMGKTHILSLSLEDGVKLHLLGGNYDDDFGGIGITPQVFQLQYFNSSYFWSYKHIAEMSKMLLFFFHFVNCIAI